MLEPCATSLSISTCIDFDQFQSVNAAALYSLVNVSSFCWMKLNEVPLPSRVNGMRLIDGALCLCCQDHSLRFYGTSLNFLTQYKPQRGDGMKHPYDVAKTHDGQLLVAAKNGLYLFDNRGGRRLSSVSI